MQREIGEGGDGIWGKERREGQEGARGRVRGDKRVRGGVRGEGWVGEGE